MQVPSIPAEAGARPLPLVRLALAAVVAFAGDALLWGHGFGVSLAVFIALLGVVMAASSRRRAGTRHAAMAVVALLAGAAPLVMDVSLLSFGISLVGLTVATLAWTGGLSSGWRAGVAWSRDVLLAGPALMVPDVAEDVRRRAREGISLSAAAAMVGWAIPVALFLVFAALLASANPIIASWAGEIPWSVLVPGMDPVRTLAWLGLVAAAWAFVCVTLRGREVRPFEPPSSWVMASIVTDAVLSPTILLRCLVLFNLLFLAQTALDATYLWAGVALPAGMTYADYAHRGAYTLMATALLAAAFTLAAMRPGGAGEESRAVRWLVLVWVAQNVLLAVSAMLRLDLYVEAYSLTLTRVAAFVWMGLVAAGLALILARIAFRLGNGWLVRSNAALLGATLYACAFVNFPAFVAGYNLEHARAGGARFDPTYAISLGPEAIPAIDAWLSGAPSYLGSPAVARRRQDLAAAERRFAGDWRAWTVRRAALLGYLRDNPLPAGPGSTWTIP